MYEIKAPNPYRILRRPWLFLSGSIEIGAAEMWQDKVKRALIDVGGAILNPRRDDWNSTWKQDISDHRFAEQVRWQLNGLEACDYAFVHFDPATKSPITLLECGYLANMDKPVVISCPEGYWWRGNLQVLCEMHGQQMRLVDDLDAAIALARKWLTWRPTQV